MAALTAIGVKSLDMPLAGVGQFISVREGAFSVILWPISAVWARGLRDINTSFDFLFGQSPSSMTPAVFARWAEEYQLQHALIEAGTSMWVPFGYIPILLSYGIDNESDSVASAILQPYFNQSFIRAAKLPPAILEALVAYIELSIKMESQKGKHWATHGPQGIEWVRGLCRPSISASSGSQPHAMAIAATPAAAVAAATAAPAAARAAAAGIPAEVSLAAELSTLHQAAAVIQEDISLTSKEERVLQDALAEVMEAAAGDALGHPSIEEPSADREAVVGHPASKASAKAVPKAKASASDNLD